MGDADDAGIGSLSMRRVAEKLGVGAMSLYRHVEDKDALLQAMVANPVLINRPVVVTPLGVRLCRPSEAVLDLLPQPQPQRGAFAKEDGEAVVDAKGQRVDKS